MSAGATATDPLARRDRWQGTPRAPRRATSVAAGRCAPPRRATRGSTRRRRTARASPTHPTGLPTERSMKNAVRLIAVSASALAYQYRNASRFLRYVLMKTRNENTNEYAARTKDRLPQRRRSDALDEERRDRAGEACQRERRHEGDHAPVTEEQPRPPARRAGLGGRAGQEHPRGDGMERGSDQRANVVDRDVEVGAARQAPDCRGQAAADAEQQHAAAQHEDPRATGRAVVPERDRGDHERDRRDEQGVADHDQPGRIEEHGRVDREVNDRQYGGERRDRQEAPQARSRPAFGVRHRRAAPRPHRLRRARPCTAPGARPAGAAR